MLEQTHRRCKIPAKAGHHAGDILQPFDAGFHMAVGRHYPETCRTTSQTTRFWRNSIKSPHSSICPGLQPVSTTQMRIHSAMTAFLTGVLAHWAPELHTHYANTLDALHTHDRSLKHIFLTSTTQWITMSVDTHLHNTQWGGCFGGWRMGFRNWRSSACPCPQMR